MTGTDPWAVAILVPVLGRPHRVAPLLASVEEATPSAHRTLFVVNDDDEAELAALETAGADFLRVPPARRSWAQKINDGFRATTEPLLFTGADDLAFHPGWFEAACARLTGATQVVGTVDQCNLRTMVGEHSTHTLVSRAYVEEFGTIDEPGKVLHEGYRHDYADDELVATAKARGAYAHAFNAIVEHLHPNVGKAPDDETYELGRRSSPNGHSVFKSRRHLWLSGSL